LTSADEPLMKRHGSPGEFAPVGEIDDLVETAAWDAGTELELELPRAKANENLAEALVGKGWSLGGAQALARACVRPDDVRRRLSAPVELRVPGGTMLVVESPVLSHGITVYPTNLRELGTRLYPLGMPAGFFPSGVIEDPHADGEQPCELVLDVDGPDQLSERLRSSEAWLSRHNPLAGDIETEGVLQPVTLVGIRVDHHNGARSVHLVTAADGSSRTAAVHRILNADAAELTYGAGSSDRVLRQQVGAVLRRVREQGWAGLDDEDRRRVRALIMPARIIVGYRQEVGRGVGFDAAIRSLIGLMHIAPPLPYGTEVARDAIANAVLDDLRRPHGHRSARITDDEARYYAASIMPGELAVAGFSPHEDVRAADITRVILHGGRRTTLRINAGIRSITSRSTISPDERVAVAVEMIMRPWRTAHATDAHLNLNARRSALQRAYGMPEIARQPDEPLLEGFPDSDYSLEELRDQALSEASAGCGRRKDKPLGSAQVELATKAAYYMIFAEPMALRREAGPSTRGRDNIEPADQRSASAVLTAMMATVRGVGQAYAVVRLGREGQPLWEREDASYLGDGAGRQPVVLTDERVRATYGGKAPRRNPQTGLAAAEGCWDELINCVKAVERASSALAAVPNSAGKSYLDEEGWSESEVDPVRRQLDRVDRRLATWSDRWSDRKTDRFQVEDLSEGKW
jgi:hypothetical protein